MNERIGTATQRAQGVFSPGIKHIAAGWVDQELVTVRKMASAGATLDEMADAIGKSANVVRRIIRQNRLNWSRKSVDRHVLLSASAIGTHVNLGHVIGGKRKQDRLSPEERSDVAKRRWATRRANGNAPPAKADRDGMLALIIRLHVEQVLSEEQVQAATGLDRAEIRRLCGEVVAA